MTLSWAASGGNAAASYVIEAGSAAGLSNLVVFDTGSAAAGLSATAPNGVFYLRVRGRNACGTGVPSNEVVLYVGVPNPNTNPQGCTYVVSPTSVPLTAPAGEFAVNVDTQPGCAWTASSQTPFITLIGSGQSTGRGAARFSVGANSGPTRDGRVQIGWDAVRQDVDVSQLGAPTNTGTLPPVSQGLTVVPNPPGTPPVVETVVEVPTPPPPPRPDSSVGPVLDPPSVATGAAPGTAEVELRARSPFNTVTVAGGTTAADGRNAATDVSTSHYVIRLTTLVTSVRLTFTTVGGRPFAAQFGASVGSERPSNYVPAGIGATGPTCNYQVTPIASNPVAASGGSVDVTVTTTAGCAWSASANAPFLSVSPASGSGTGGVRVSVSSNPGAARSGNARISWAGGGQDVTVSQSALQPCTISLTGPSSPLPNTSGMFDVTVNTPAGCSWTAWSLSPSIVSVVTGSGTGTGNARFSITANTGSATRSATVRVQVGSTTQDFTVTQLGVCTYSVSPTSVGPISASGATFGVTVTTQANCAWSATTTSFITPTSTSGSGSANRTFTVTPNTGPARNGIVRVAWSGGFQDVNVSQSAAIPPLVITAGSTCGNFSAPRGSRYVCTLFATNDYSDADSIMWALGSQHTCSFLQIELVTIVVPGTGGEVAMRFGGTTPPTSGSCVISFTAFAPGTSTTFTRTFVTLP